MNNKQTQVDGKTKALAGIAAIYAKANGKGNENNEITEKLAENIINKNKALISDTPISSYAAITENQENKTYSKPNKTSTVKRTIVEDEDYEREPNYNDYKQIIDQNKNGSSIENRSLHIEDKREIYKFLAKSNPEKYQEYLKLEEEKKIAKPKINENIKKVFEPTYYSENTNKKPILKEVKNNYDTDIEKAVKDVINEMCKDSAFEDTLLTKLINKEIESNKKIELLEKSIKMLLKKMTSK